MSSTKAMGTKDQTDSGPPTLPQNVFIFSPAAPVAAKALLNGCMFTRLTIGRQTKPAQLLDALRNKQQLEVDETFCLCHGNVILIFDSDMEGKDLQDIHHEHFRTVCLVLKDEDITLDVAGCVFDTPTAVQAGFQLEELSSGSVMVVDIMSGDDSSDDDDEDSDDAGVQLFPTIGDIESTKS
jgi:hypothetical protein